MVTLLLVLLHLPRVFLLALSQTKPVHSFCSPPFSLCVFIIHWTKEFPSLKSQQIIGLRARHDLQNIKNFVSDFHTQFKTYSLKWPSVSIKDGEHGQVCPLYVCLHKRENVWLAGDYNAKDRAGGGSGLSQKVMMTKSECVIESKKMFEKIWKKVLWSI